MNSKIPEVGRNKYGHNLWLIAATVAWILVIGGIVMTIVGTNGYFPILFGLLAAIPWSVNAWHTHKGGAI